MTIKLLDGIIMRLASISRLLVLAVLTATGLAGVSAPTAGASYGVQAGSFAIGGLNEDGTPYTRAGGHPFQFVTAFVLKTKPDPLGGVEADGNAKNLRFMLPAGVVGYGNAVPTCNEQQLFAIDAEKGLEEFESGGACPPSTQVGQIELRFRRPGHGEERFVEPVFNMLPHQGEAAALEFLVAYVPVRVSVKVAPSGGYALEAEVHDISEAISFGGSRMILWGVPADPAHDPVRGRGCKIYPEESCVGGNQTANVLVKPFLTVSDDCAHGLFTTAMSTDSWQEPDRWLFYRASSAGVSGCDRLVFRPEASVVPTASTPVAPSGLSVDLRVPQAVDPYGPSTPTVRDVSVKLPVGFSLSPSVANGLDNCSDSQFALHGDGRAECPSASQIGTVRIDTPALDEPLTGVVYVGSQLSDDPMSGTMYRLFIEAQNKARGVRIKLEGAVFADPQTGQLTAVFDENPQQPFSDMHLQLKSGPRAPLVTPDACGTHTVETTLTAWSGQEAQANSSFEVHGCEPERFSPAFTAGSTNVKAGGFTPFVLTLSRQDQEGLFNGVSVKLPPGLIGIVKSIEQCPDVLAAEGTCGSESLIGHVTVAVGVGSAPYWLTGDIHLTGPYEGAPFGLSINVPAIAGPFNLGSVVVRGRIMIDSHTAQLIVSTDPLPTVVRGVPIHLRTVSVTIDRPRFMLNPTSCSPLSVVGTMTSTQGAASITSSRFQVAECRGLPFKPALTASTSAHHSRKDGASLHVTLTSSKGQANIHYVRVTLPNILPSRLETLNHACTDSTFETSPAACPPASRVGTATATTPLLARTLAGPVYFVSHGAAKFPDIVIVLQAENITVDVVGNTRIKHDKTSSTFTSIPDVPVTQFDLTLPTGPYSALAALGHLCHEHHKLTMPTVIKGQNGPILHHNTPIHVNGCKGS